MPDRLKQATGVKPRDPFQRGELDVLQTAPPAPTPNDLESEWTLHFIVVENFFEELKARVGN